MGILTFIGDVVQSSTKGLSKIVKAEGTIITSTIGDTVGLSSKISAQLGDVAKASLSALGKTASDSKLVANAATEVLMKNNDELALAVAKTSGKEVIEQSTKQSDNFLKTAGSKIDDVAKKPLQTADNAIKSQQNFIMRNKGLIAGGIAVGTIAGVALDKFIKMNDKKLTIILISPQTVGGVLGIGGTDAIYVEFAGNKDDSYVIGDVVVITQTNSEAVADGTYIIKKKGTVGNNFYFIVDKGSDSAQLPIITKNGTSGIITYKTTFESQAGQTISDAVGGVADTTGDIIGNTGKMLGVDLSEYKTEIYIFLGFLALILFVWLVSKINDIFSSRNKEPIIIQQALPPTAPQETTSAAPPTTS